MLYSPWKTNTADELPLNHCLTEVVNYISICSELRASNRATTRSWKGKLHPVLWLLYLYFLSEMKKPFALRCVSHWSVSLWLAAADPDVAYNWNACPRIAWDCSVLLSSELGLTACWPAWGVYWAEKWLGVGEQLLGGWAPPGCWSPDLTNASTREGAAVAAWFAARHHTMGSNLTMQLSSSSISSVPERSCPSPHCCSLICASRELLQIVKVTKTTCATK